MNKKSTLIAATILAMTATTAFAGAQGAGWLYDLGQTGSSSATLTTHKVASELVLSQSAAPGIPTDVSALLSGKIYNPQAITLTTLTDGLVQLLLPTGVSWTVPAAALKAGDGTGLNICEMSVGSAIKTRKDPGVLAFKQIATNQMVFDKGTITDYVAPAAVTSSTGSIANGRQYYLGKRGVVANIGTETLAATNIAAVYAAGVSTINISGGVGTSTLVAGDLIRITTVGVGGAATDYTVTNTVTAVAGVYTGVTFTPVLVGATLGAGVDTVRVAAVQTNTNCAPLAYGDIQVNVPPTMTSITLNALLGISSNGTVEDSTGAKEVVKVVQHLTASIPTTDTLDGKITPSSGFTLFNATHTKDLVGSTAPFNGTTLVDNVRFTIAADTTINDKPETRMAGSVAVADLTNAADYVQIVLKTTGDISDVLSASITEANAGPTACTISTSAKTITCNMAGVLTQAASDAGAAGTNYNVAITVKASTALTEKVFTADVMAVYNNTTTVVNTSIKDHDSSWKLLTDAAAGNWSYDATVVYVPAVRFDSTGTIGNKLSETYFRIFSTDSTVNANKVTAVVYADSATPVSVNVNCYAADGSTVLATGNTIPLNSKDGGCYFSATSIQAAAVAAGATFNQGGTTSTFPVKLVITTNATSLYGYATQVVNGAVGQRRVPLFTNTGKAGLDN